MVMAKIIDSLTCLLSFKTQSNETHYLKIGNGWMTLLSRSRIQEIKSSTINYVSNAE